MIFEERYSGHEHWTTGMTRPGKKAKKQCPEQWYNSVPDNGPDILSKPLPGRASSANDQDSPKYITIKHD